MTDTSFRLQIPDVSEEQIITLKGLSDAGLMVRIKWTDRIPLIVAGTPAAFEIYREVENVSDVTEKKIAFLQLMGRSMYKLCVQSVEKAKDDRVMNGIQGKLFKAENKTGPSLMYWLFVVPKIREVVMLMFSEAENAKVDTSMEEGLRMEMVNAAYRLARGNGTFIETSEPRQKEVD